MKKFGLSLLAAAFVFGLVAVCTSQDAVAKTTYVTIGTGGVTGVYYPTGGAIGRIVNKKRKEYNLRVTVESTTASVFNVNAMMAGDLEFGIVQSDRDYQAWNGLAEWADRGKQTKLRSVFSIHPESVTMVAAADSGIKSCADMKGKAVAIGAPGSGTRQNTLDAMATCGLTEDDLGRAEGLKPVEAAKMLQDGRIDAFFYTVGHPNGSVKEATSGRIKVHLVPFTNVDDLLAKYSYYAKSFIPKKFYPKALNEEDVPTFGVKANFMTSSDVPDDVVYVITKEVFENLEDFKKLHPAYTGLTPENMLEGLTSPFHPGALKYYKEVGLIK